MQFFFTDTNKKGERVRVATMKFLRSHSIPNLIFAFFLFTFFSLLLFSAPLAQAFDGPLNAPGIGSGAFGYSGGRFSVGTSTPFSEAKFLIITSSTDNFGYAFKVVNPICSGGQEFCPAVFSIRNDGSVVIGGGQTGTNSTYGTNYYQPPNSTYEKGLTIWGPAFINGPLLAGNFIGFVGADHIAPSVFNGGVSANYAFPTNLAIATSSNLGIPQPLSVYGGGYFSGSVGIGTASPQALLDLRASAPQLKLDSTSYGITSYISSWGLTTGAESIMTFGNNARNEIRAGHSATGGYLDFYTNNVASFPNASDGIHTMRLSAAGNVGIGTGTTNPSYGLHVQKAGDTSPAVTTIEQTAATNYPTLLVKQNTAGGNNNSDQGLLVDVQGTSSGSGRAFHVKGQNSTRFIVMNGGNVGIGTTGPDGKLHIAPSADFDYKVKFIGVPGGYR
ncbi:MAG: hypothetical protein NUV53_04375, partial [Patescibacteria group bacterium]|nr:hypothetical protein [Patescibacteria group bacterium]